MLFPPIRRAMAFIDGENLVLRYQAMLGNGAKPKPDVKHFRDVYVWQRNSIVVSLHEVLRATYYTYAVGDEDRLHHIRGEIKAFEFQPTMITGLPLNLYPCVFKNSKNGAKGKGVDIQLTVDILTQAYQNNVDTVYLMSGDGDYQPVIQEVLRSGRQVHLAAFSSGLNPRLPHIVDKFIDLDSLYFEQSK